MRVSVTTQPEHGNLCYREEPETLPEVQQATWTRALFSSSRKSGQADKFRSWPALWKKQTNNTIQDVSNNVHPLLPQNCVSLISLSQHLGLGRNSSQHQHTVQAAASEPSGALPRCQLPGLSDGWFAGPEAGLSYHKHSILQSPATVITCSRALPCAGEWQPSAGRWEHGEPSCVAAPKSWLHMHLESCLHSRGIGIPKATRFSSLLWKKSSQQIPQINAIRKKHT